MSGFWSVDRGPFYKGPFDLGRLFQYGPALSLSIGPALNRVTVALGRQCLTNQA